MGMEHTRTEEAKRKAKETKANNIRQKAIVEDQETDIVIDYEMKRFTIYTNKATVMSRLERMGHKFVTEDTVDGDVYSRTYTFPLKEIGGFLRKNIFG
jgi:azurin